MIDVGWLAETGPCKMFREGQDIPCPGGSESTERAMYILIVGKVEVFKVQEKGAPVLLGELHPGEAFGGREFFTDAAENVYTATVDSVVYVLSRSSFTDLSWAQPDILYEVLKAAYMPLKKTPATPKKEGAKSAVAASKQKEAETQKSAAKAKAAEKAKVAAQNAAIGALRASQVQIVAENSIFPEGHKFYPIVTKQEHTRFIYKKDYTCPFCNKDFEDYRVFRSKLYESAPMRYDLRRFYTDFQTEWYDVITCRHCYYSMLHNYFTDPKPIQKDVIENELTAARASILLDFDAERDVNFVFTAHYLAILCAGGYRSITKLVRSKLWGNLSWLYEDVGDEEMMAMAAAKSAEIYESIYAETRLTPAQEQITCLSIAGMQYRAGIDRDIKKYLFTARTLKDGDKTYALLAEDLIDLIKAKENKA